MRSILVQTLGKCRRNLTGWKSQLSRRQRIWLRNGTALPHWKRRVEMRGPVCGKLNLELMCFPSFRNDSSYFGSSIRQICDVLIQFLKLAFDLVR